MICPQCHTEYRPGFDQCADCNVPLVEALPESPSEPGPSIDPDAEWEIVANINMQSDVAILKSMLESEGVPFVVVGDTSATIDVGSAMSSRFMVPVDHLAHAREVVAQLAEGYQGPPKWND